MGTVALNFVRILAAALWTGIVGTPLLLVIYARYWYGLLAARFGRRDVLDRALEANAWLAGWVAQRLWASGLLWIARIQLRWRESVPVDWSATHVICANHASVFDILALIRVLPPPFRFVAKRELLKWPIIGWALRPAGQIVVNRRDHAQALQSIAAAAEHHIKGQVIFFVEGTRTHTGELLPFKKGAFHFAVEHRLPVLPVAVCGSYAALAKLPWWRLHPGRAIEVVIRGAIAPPLPTDGAMEGLLKATRAQIATALNEAEVEAA